MWMRLFAIFSSLLTLTVAASWPKSALADTQAISSTTDPAAVAIVQKSLDTYLSLKAFSAQATLKHAGVNYASATIAWQRPGEFHIEETVWASDGKTYQTAAVSNGVTYTRRSFVDEPHYYQSKDRNSIFNNSDEAGVSVFTLNGFLEGHTPSYFDSFLKMNTSHSTPGEFSSMKLSPPSTLDGVDVDIVEDNWNIPHVQSHIALWIGRDDHLIRRVVRDLVWDNPKHPLNIHSIEEYTRVVSSDTLPANTFVYTPPSGVTKGSSQNLASAYAAEELTFYDSRHLVVGAKPADFIAKDLSGNPVNLAQYRGKVVILDFWATWCAPCVEELPNVISTYRQYHRRGLDVVGVSLDEDRSALTGFIASKKIPYRIVYCGKKWDNPVALTYKVHAIPFAMVIGRDGRIAAVDVRGDGLRSAVKKALAANLP